MTNGTLSAVLTQYRRLLTTRGRASLNHLIARAALSGLLEGLALLAVLWGAAALAAGRPALGLGVTGWVLLMGALGAGGFLVAYLLAQSSYRTALDIMRTCHQVIGDKIASLPLGWFGVSRAATYSRAVTAGMMSMGQALAHSLSSLFSRMVMVCTLLLGLWLWQPRLGLILTLAVPVYALTVWAVGKLAFVVKKRAEPAKCDLSLRVVEYAGAQGALRSAGRSADPPHLQSAITAEEKVSMRTLLAESGLLLLAGTVSQLIIVALIFFAADQAMRGDLGAIEAVTFIGVCLRLVQSLTDIGEQSVGLQDQSPTLAAISEVLDAPTMPMPDSSVAPVADASVDVRQVSFSYVPGRPVLRNVSLRMAPHTMTALVGPSGSGKTTLAKLISRFYDCDGGAIMIGGQDVRNLTTTDLMAQLSMVFQDVYLFNDTLEANIRVGRDDATDEEVYAAAQTAGVTEIAHRLPGGWSARVGEGGGRLSGGERQRVSIARALLKQAPIVLVDEATSALDAENEAKIKDALDQLRAKSTVLVIAHKLETIRSADHIVVLDAHGTVAQVGVHDELVDQAGIYQRFWRQREQAEGWHLV